MFLIFQDRCPAFDIIFKTNRPVQLATSADGRPPCGTKRNRKMVQAIRSLTSLEGDGIDCSSLHSRWAFASPGASPIFGLQPPTLARCRVVCFIHLRARLRVFLSYGGCALFAVRLPARIARSVPPHRHGPVPSDHRGVHLLLQQPSCAFVPAPSSTIFINRLRRTGRSTVLRSVLRSSPRDSSVTRPGPGLQAPT